jgi:hypothetical protein
MWNLAGFGPRLVPAPSMMVFTATSARNSSMRRCTVGIEQASARASCFAVMGLGPASAFFKRSSFGFTRRPF